GNPLYQWNDRNFRTRQEYDELQRPVATWLSENGAAEQQVYKTTYGEQHATPADFNLIGQPWKVYDQSGLRTSMLFDFKGNPLQAILQVAADYKNRLNWAASPQPALEPEIFQTQSQFDALNRPSQTTAIDGSITLYTYNEANFLEKIQTRLRGAAALTDFVKNIDYDAKGQRTKIQYGNGVTTTYHYDPKTFRLVRLRSTRPVHSPPSSTNPPNNTLLQDLKYWYDPVGNITDMQDDAQDYIFFANQVVKPHSRYTYDPLYRLVNAEGREQIGQSSQPNKPQHDFIVTADINPGDGQAMRRYTQTYVYDALGNILEVRHQAGQGTNHANTWTRKYHYAEPSALNPSRISNRLSKTTILGNDYAYTHDVHGNMTSMPHLPEMRWDFADQLKEVQLPTGREYYTYTMAGGKDFGVRTRKVTEKPGGKICDRIYIGDFEVYRERNATGAVELERETLHIQDDKGRLALVDTLTIENGQPTAANNQLLRYQLSNHLGSACLELDRDADLISYEEYYPFGASSYRSGRSAAEVSLKRYRYVGKERDESTGLDYYGARYY
ncbi:MAG: hypothetical protein KDC61_23755, partial [Saprospiraceae bacterium]|nr:hypothetical protein [Saprospiraceae bacterium]